MAKKITSKGTVLKKPVKKIKSFNVDDRIYSGLMEILETSGARVNLSTLVDEFLRKFYIYLLEADGLVKRKKSDLPLSRVIYDCMEIEYFRVSNEKDMRIQNLIWAREAEKAGISLSELFSRLPDEELSKAGMID